MSWLPFQKSMTPRRANPLRFYYFFYWRSASPTTITITTTNTTLVFRFTAVFRWWTCTFPLGKAQSKIRVRYRSWSQASFSLSQLCVSFSLPNAALGRWGTLLSRYSIYSDTSLSSWRILSFEWDCFRGADVRKSLSTRSRRAAAAAAADDDVGDGASANNHFSLLF